jgi:glycosyltransferase involved in cell wall biosynthesis
MSSEARVGGVSVIIPIHNEAGVIGDVVRRTISSTPGLIEVIVVDDGSTDDGARIAESAGARVERLEKNRGKGFALRCGMSVARGGVLVFLDGDGQDAPEEIPLLLDALGPNVDLVIGSRFLGAFRPGAITWSNRVGTRLLTAVLNTLFRVSITDPIAGFRAVRRDALDRCQLSAERYDIEVDLLLAMLTSGERVVEVPVHRSARLMGRTGLVPLIDGTRILLRIVAHRMRH